MAWIEFHQTMPRHTKTLALARMMRVPRREAVGIMADLWTWALDNAEIDGRLPGMYEEDIATALDYPLDRAEELVSALISSGFIDRDFSGLSLHNWYKYAGKLNERRAADRARKERKDAGNPQEFQRNENGRTPEFLPLPYPTVPLDDDEDDLRARARAAYAEAFGREPTDAEVSGLCRVAYGYGRPQFLVTAIHRSALYGAKYVVGYIETMMANWRNFEIETEEELAQYDLWSDCISKRNTLMRVSEAFEAMRAFRDRKRQQRKEQSHE